MAAIISKKKKRGRKPEYPERTPDDEPCKQVSHTKDRNPIPDRDSNPDLQHWWQASDPLRYSF